MKLRVAGTILSYGLFFCGPSAYAQAPAASGAAKTSTPQSTPVAQDCFTGAVNDLKDSLSKNPRDRGAELVKVRIWAEYICYETSKDVRTKLLGTAEATRLDKQPGSTSSAAGSTSLVSKGSSPSLLGFALEYGGLTQTTNGNTVTFRGNAANTVCALETHSYEATYEKCNANQPARNLAKLSFGVSFDAGSSQTVASQGFAPSSTNLSAFYSKYELINHRDPRDPRWKSNWASVENDAFTVVSKLGNLNDKIGIPNDSSDPWTTAAQKMLDGLSSSSTDGQIRKSLESLADTFRGLFWNRPDVQAAIAGVSTSLSGYIDTESTALNGIRKSSLFTLEYTLTRQQQAAAGSNVSATQPNQGIPSLSDFNFVYEKGITGTTEITANAGFTLFNASSSTRGAVRDYRASVELDVPLREISNIGSPVLSFAGQFLALINEPLGQQVMINGVTETRTGNMGVFQTKLSIPVKNSGVKIPISFTYASRTELVKERDIRGNIGITFDLDSLFSQTK